jgi:hypothetical protein
VGMVFVCLESFDLKKKEKEKRKETVEEKKGIRMNQKLLNKTLRFV